MIKVVSELPAINHNKENWDVLSWYNSYIKLGWMILVEIWYKTWMDYLCIVLVKKTRSIFVCIWYKTGMDYICLVLV